jgi:hypothetical protein
MMDSTTYALSAWFLSRGISLCFVLAFLSLVPQLMGLYGKNGILSIDTFIRVLKEQTGVQRYYELPTLFWLNSSDFFLNFVAMTGLFASTLSFMGFCPPLMLVLAWLCYLSFVNAGQDFLGFQWDVLLLEVGFLGFFLPPWQFDWQPWAAFEPSLFVRWLFWALLFKLMFLSGIVKIISRDVAWRNFTALDYHYWTQPIPNVISYFIAKMPGWSHRLMCVSMFAIELVIPFCIFFSGPLRWAGAALLVSFQVLIWLTGNYAFFNLITAVLSLFLFEDAFWEMFLPRVFPSLHVVAQTSPLLESVGIVLAIILLPLNIFWFGLTFRESSRWLNPLLPIIQYLYNFRINSSYGLFAVMTKERPELVLQGSNDTETWLEYEFKFKPCRLEKMPPLVAPHQPRLDWQMWFAALGTFSQNLWLQNLMARIFLNSEDVLRLLRKNPFPEVPLYMRLVKYQYKFSPAKSLFEKGQWWQREYVGLYSPIFEKSDFVGEEDSLEVQEEI